MGKRLRRQPVDLPLVMVCERMGSTWDLRGLAALEEDQPISGAARAWSSHFPDADRSPFRTLLA